MSIKDVCSQGRGEFVQCGHFLDNEILHMRTSALVKFMVSHGQERGGGVEPSDIFRTRGGNQFFAICVDVLYGWPLSSFNFRNLGLHIRYLQRVLCVKIRRLHKNGKSSKALKH